MQKSKSAVLFLATLLNSKAIVTHLISCVIQKYEMRIKTEGIFS